MCLQGPFTFSQLLRSQYLLLLLFTTGFSGYWHCHCPNFTVFNSLSTLSTHTHRAWLNYFNQTCLSLFAPCTLASTALLVSSSFLSFSNTSMPPWLLAKGVRGKKGSEDPFTNFRLLPASACRSRRQVGSHFLGFTPGLHRPAAVRGPAPLPLTKLGFPSGSFQRVGGKRASEALSFQRFSLSSFSSHLFLLKPMHRGHWGH